MPNKKSEKKCFSFQSVQTTRWYLVSYERFLYLFTNKIEPLSKKEKKDKMRPKHQNKS